MGLPLHQISGIYLIFGIATLVYMVFRWPDEIAAIPTGREVKFVGGILIVWPFVLFILFARPPKE